VGIKSIDISVEPARVGRWLVAVFALLLLAHAGGLLMTYRFDHDYVYGLVPLFNITLEGNIPTFFASGLFVTGGALFLLLWRLNEQGSSERRVWLILGVIFFYLAVDEFAAIHERLIVPVREEFNTGGLLFFAWIIPYSIAVLALALWVAPTLWRLGGRFRLLFGLSAGVFLSGAVGVEMLGGRHFEANNETVDLTYRLYQTAEEFLEFTGLILLVYTQLALLRARVPVASLHLAFQPQNVMRTTAPTQVSERPSIKVIHGKRG